MSNRDHFENGEADSWFLRNKPGLENAGTNEGVEMLVSWLKPFQSQIHNILEIGCGSGHVLDALAKSLEARGHGVEPSEKAVEYIKHTFPSLQASVGFGDSLPLARTFNYVHLGFFLYLVDRDRYLQCVSEADRMVEFGGFLSIVDFETPFPYSNEYSHRQGVYSHKIRNTDVFVASGLYSVVHKYQFSHSAFHFDPTIDQRVSLSLLYKEKAIFKGTE